MSTDGLHPGIEAAEATYRSVLEAAEAARGSRVPAYVDDEVTDDHNVMLIPGDSRDPNWVAQLVDAGGGTLLWWARGRDQSEALVNLALVLGDELAERAHFVPEGYIDRQDRPRRRRDGAVPRYRPTVDVALPEFHLCQVCGCTDEDCSQCVELTGRPCVWSADDLCSACADPHQFDPHPDNPARCSLCMQWFAPMDPVCQTGASQHLAIAGYLEVNSSPTKTDVLVAAFPDLSGHLDRIAWP